MKSLSQAVFMGLMLASMVASASGSASSKKEDPGLKSVKTAACSKRAEVSLGDCTDSSCQKAATGAPKKAAGTDGSKAGG